jgi:RNA polymerase sigma factor (sigma-70 family)
MKNTILRSTTSLQSDNRLVEMVRAGVEPAFDTIVQRYRSPLLRYASRMVDSDRAEDVVQEALVKAHGTLLQHDREIQLKPWLYRITHNLALDAVRQKSWNYDQLDDNYDGVRQPPDYFEQKESLRAIIEHMDTLPERQRRALILQAFEGRSSEEIARELDDGVPEARQLVHRARVRMRNAFGALIPMPVLLWLRQGSASAATTASASGSKMLFGGALRMGLAKLATTAAIAVVVGAGAGVVVGETAIRNVAAEPMADVSPIGDADGSAAGDSRAGGGKSSSSNADLSGPAASEGPGESGSQGGSGSEAGDSPSKGRDAGGGGAADSDSGAGSGSGDSTRSPAQQPSDAGSGSGGGSTGSDRGSSGSGSTGSGSTGSGSSGDGSSGGGSTGGGGTGGGGTGDGSDQTCIGPVAQLPPICLPNLGGGSGSGGGGLLP